MIPSPNDKKIIDYKILYERYESGGRCLPLSFQVKELLNNGWNLYGYPFESQELLHQAMVKYEEENDSKSE